MMVPKNFTPEDIQKQLEEIQEWAVEERKLEDAKLLQDKVWEILQQPPGDGPKNIADQLEMLVADLERAFKVAQGMKADERRLEKFRKLNKK